MQTWVKVISIGIFIFFPGISSAQIHRIGIETRPGYIFPTSSFLKGGNAEQDYISRSVSTHLRYSFRFRPNTLAERIYNNPYQGIGLAYFSFGERKHMGSPVAAYLFQGARIARFTDRLSLNYEWNFGVSFGWKPYSPEDNPYNVIIGSKANAYLNASLQLNWMLSRRFELITGFTLTHFSNGNTSFPNAGLNTADFRLGLVYNFDNGKEPFAKPATYYEPVPAFKRHVSYDVVLFGSWRCKVIENGDNPFVSPDKYTVLGFNFNPMYNFGYRFRAGLSLDGVYDQSANLYAGEYYNGSTPELYKPSFIHQAALGVSGRAEYVMPYFSVGMGMGVNVLRSGTDFKTFYQILSLKINVTRNSFLHIGYSLSEFHDPNFLMLGIGFRLHNKTPRIHR